MTQALAASPSGGGVRWKRFLPVNHCTLRAPEPPVPGGRRCPPRFCGTGKDRLAASRLTRAAQPLPAVAPPRQRTGALRGSPGQRGAGSAGPCRPRCAPASRRQLGVPVWLLHWHTERLAGTRVCAVPVMAKKSWREVRPLKTLCALGVSSQVMPLTVFLDFSRHVFSFSLIHYQLLSLFHVSFQVMKFRTFCRNPQICVRSWLKFCFQNTCKSYCVTGKFLVFSPLPLLLFNKSMHLFVFQLPTSASWDL